MVAWYWLIVTFIVGGMAGIFIAALLGANRERTDAGYDERRHG